MSWSGNGRLDDKGETEFLLIMVSSQPGLFTTSSMGDRWIKQVGLLPIAVWETTDRTQRIAPGWVQLVNSEDLENITVLTLTSC